MANRNTYIIYAKKVLRRMRQLEEDDRKLKDIDSVLWGIDKGVHTYEDWIQDAKMIGVRNPSFDGDYVGWLDDDFDKDDKNDKDDDSNTPEK